MNVAIKNLQDAFNEALATRPKVNGFPVIAEVLRKFGVIKNIWSLPSCQSIYITSYGNVVSQTQSLIDNMSVVPGFDEIKLVKSIRADQAGETTFREFLSSAWLAGVTGYKVDFINRSVLYYGIEPKKSYLESYPAVTI